MNVYWRNASIPGWKELDSTLRYEIGKKADRAILRDPWSWFLIVVFVGCIVTLALFVSSGSVLRELGEVLLIVIPIVLINLRKREFVRRLIGKEDGSKG